MNVDVDLTNVDAVLAKEMGQLSFEVRNKIQEEVHGVESFCPRETPEMLDEALRRFQQEIDLIPTKRAYDYAQSVLRSQYIHEKEFRIRYIRLALFNVKEAAAKFTVHLDFLLDYIGEEALQRPLRYSDLNATVQEVFRAGNYQLLPSRDRAGRLVCMAKPVNCSLNIRVSGRTCIYI
jgi:hypothetical protein